MRVGHELIGKSVVLPSHVRTNVVASLYISLMRVMYLVGTLYFSKAHHMIFLTANECITVIFRNFSILILGILILIKNSIIDKQVCKI